MFWGLQIGSTPHLVSIKNKLIITSVALDVTSIRKKSHLKKPVQVFLLAHNAKKTLFANVSADQPHAVVSVNVTGDFSLIVKGSGRVHLSGWLEGTTSESKSPFKQKSIDMKKSETLKTSSDDSDESSSNATSINSSGSSSEHDSTCSAGSSDEDDAKQVGMKLMVPLEAESADTSYEKLDGSNKRRRAKKTKLDNSALKKQQKQVKREKMSKQSNKSSKH